VLLKAVIAECQSFLGEEINSVRSISGGSINDAYLISSATDHFFIKTNRGKSALENFKAEAKGLQLLANTNTIKIPKVIKVGKVEQSAFLILEYIPSRDVTPVFWEKLGTQLAKLHQTSADHFGLDHDNFIGSLPQKNHPHDNWTDFFIHERILPQIHLAENKQLLRSPLRNRFDVLFKKLNSIFPKEKPALIHGDLWSGNFIKGNEDTPFF